MKKNVLGVFFLIVSFMIQPVLAQENGQKEPAKDLMTPEILWSLGRVSDPQVSPDLKQILFGVTRYNVAENKGNRDLFVMDTDGKNLRQITNTPKSESQAVWLPSGLGIGFISTESGSPQLWIIQPDGTGKRQVTSYESGINGFRFSPTGNKVLFAMDVKLDPTVQEVYPDLPKANARIETDLMYRHWDVWSDQAYSHIFVGDFTNGAVGPLTDIMEGQRFDSPMNPFGGMEQIAWSPDGKKIAYTCKRLTGKAYSLSTNSDVLLYDLASRMVKNLSEGMMGYDMAPVFSPDGKMLAWESMERDGYEADKIRLILYDLTTGNPNDVSRQFDQNAEKLVFSADCQTIFFVSDFQARHQIYAYDLPKKTFRAVTTGDQNYLLVIPAGKVLIGEKQSIALPTEIFSIDPKTGKETQLTFTNKAILDQLTLARTEERWVNTTDGKKMLVWVTYPPHFDPGKKYPALLYCQGGPQSSVSQFFSYRWNFQIMAANGYIVVAPNRRGVPSFGQEWNEQISGDYGGQNMKDYLAAIDNLAAEPFVDKDRLGAVGASYGGFSVFWLAGHHEKRFKAFIAHDGMFNLESQYLETEEMWFVNWDLGGPFWDKNNAIAQKSYANSPHRFVDKWDTPILVIHGGKDFRIADTQGMSAFNAAVLRGIPAEFLYFPEENHWVLSPQNGILWQRTFFKWLDRWLK